MVIYKAHLHILDSKLPSLSDIGFTSYEFSKMRFLKALFFCKPNVIEYFCLRIQIQCTKTTLLFQIAKSRRSVQFLQIFKIFIELKYSFLYFVSNFIIKKILFFVGYSYLKRFLSKIQGKVPFIFKKRKFLNQNTSIHQKLVQLVIVILVNLCKNFYY